jgi:hypothetical protein
VLIIDFEDNFSFQLAVDGFELELGFFGGNKGNDIESFAERRFE